MKVQVEQEYEKLCSTIAEALIHNPRDAEALMLYNKLAIQDKLLVKNILHRYYKCNASKPFPVRNAVAVIILSILLFAYLMRSWF